MSGYPLPGIAVNPQALLPTGVTITDDVGNIATVYADPYGVTPLTLPMQISGPHTFYMQGPGVWFVNAKPIQLYDTHLATVNLGSAPIPIYNVVDFGAKLDGVTNDTHAWMTAFATLPPYSILEAPPGTSIVDANTILMPNNIWVYLPGVTMKFSGNNGGSGIPVLGYSNASPANITIEGLTMDLAGGTADFIGGTSSSPSSSLPGINIVHCKFLSSANMSGQSNITVPAPNSSVKHNTIANLKGIQVSTGTGGQPHFNLSFNQVYSSGAVAMSFGTGTALGTGEVGNYATAVGNILDGVADVQIHLNNIGGNNSNNLVANGASGSFNGFILSIEDQGTISNNVIYNMNVPSNSHGGVNTGAANQAMTGNVVQGCTFKNTGACFLSDAVFGVSIVGNVAVGNTAATGALVGVNSQGGGQQSIVGNVLIGPGTSATAHKAINSGTCSRYTFSENYIEAWNTGISVLTNSSLAGAVGVTGNTFLNVTGSWVSFGGTNTLQGLTVTGNNIVSGGTDAVYGAVINKAEDVIFVGNNYSQTGGASSSGCLHVLNCTGVVNVACNNFDTAASAPATAIVVDSTSPILVTNNAGGGTITSIITTGTNIQKANNYAWNGSAWAGA